MAIWSGCEVSGCPFRSGAYVSMRHLISILLVLGALYFGKQLFLKYQSLEENQPQPGQTRQATRPNVAAADSHLPGLPPGLETSLAAARNEGAPGLERWLAHWGHAISDPRLASIQLDYVVLVSRQDAEEAKRVFQSVSARTKPSSPVYQRVKSLTKTYE